MLKPEQLASVAAINFGDAMAQTTVRKLLDHIYGQNARIASMADLELALFAENQKRQDVELERDWLQKNVLAERQAYLLERDKCDQLLAAMEGLLAEHAVPSSGCKDRPAYEQALIAIASAKGGAK